MGLFLPKDDDDEQHNKTMTFQAFDRYTWALIKSFAFKDQQTFESDITERYRSCVLYMIEDIKKRLYVQSLKDILKECNENIYNLDVLNTPLYVNIEIEIDYVRSSLSMYRSLCFNILDAVDVLDSFSFYRSLNRSLSKTRNTDRILHNRIKSLKISLRIVD